MALTLTLWLRRDRDAATGDRVALLVAALTLTLTALTVAAVAPAVVV